MENNFKMGDVVRHKSNSKLRMAVKSVENESVECEYFCKKDHKFKSVDLWHWTLKLAKSNPPLSE